MAHRVRPKLSIDRGLSQVNGSNPHALRDSCFDPAGDSGFSGASGALRFPDRGAAVPPIGYAQIHVRGNHPGLMAIPISSRGRPDIQPSQFIH